MVCVTTSGPPGGTARGEACGAHSQVRMRSTMMHSSPKALTWRSRVGPLRSAKAGLLTGSIDSRLNFYRTSVDVTVTIGDALESEVASTHRVGAQAIVSVHDRQLNRTGYWNPATRGMHWRHADHQNAATGPSQPAPTQHPHRAHGTAVHTTSTATARPVASDRCYTTSAVHP